MANTVEITIQGVDRASRVFEQMEKVATSSLNDIEKNVTDIPNIDIDADLGSVQAVEKELQDIENNVNDIPNVDIDADTKPLIDAEKQLNDVEKEVEDIPDLDIESDTSGIEEADSSLDGLGKTAKRVAGLMVAVFAVDKVKDFAWATVEASASMQALESQFSQVFGELESTAQDSLDAIAEETGILPNRLRASFVQMSAFAKTTGMDTAQSLELTERATLAAADSAAFYDKSIEDVTESLQSFLKGNFENDAALGISATETTRNAKANELYGQSFIDLDEAQKQLTLLAMVEDGNKLSGALGQAARETDGLENVLGNLRSAWNDFMVAVGNPLLALATPIIKGITGAISGLTSVISVSTDSWTENIEDFFTRFSNTWNAMKSIISGGMPSAEDSVGGFLGAFNVGAFQKVVNQVSTIWGELSDAFETDGLEGAMAYIGDLIPRMIEWGQNLILGLIEGIQENLPEITEALTDGLMKYIDNLGTIYPVIFTAGVEILMALLEGLLEALPMLLESVLTLADTLVAVILEQLPTLISLGIVLIQNIMTGITTVLPQFLETGIQLLMTFITGILSYLPELLNTVLMLIQFMISLIIENLPLIIEMGIQLLQALIEGILVILPDLLTVTIELIIAIIEMIAENLPLIIEAGIQILTALIDGIAEMLPELTVMAIRLIVRLASELIKNLPKIIDAGWDILIAVGDGIWDALKEFLKVIPKVAGEMIDEFLDTDWLELGKDIIRGIAEGIKNAGDIIWDAVKSAANSVVSWFGDVFKMGSPSRLMEDEIGQWIPKGIAVGIEGNMDAVEDAMALSLPNVPEFPVQPQPMADMRPMNIRQMIADEVSNIMDNRMQPLELRLRLGTQDFVSYVEDITRVQRREESRLRRFRGEVT